MAISCARRIFGMVSGHQAPAFTVASLATITVGRPSTRPMPVMTPAAGAWPSYLSWATRSPISRNMAPVIDQFGDALARGQLACLVLLLDLGGAAALAQFLFEILQFRHQPAHVICRCSHFVYSIGHAGDDLLGFDQRVLKAVWTVFVFALAVALIYSIRGALITFTLAIFLALLLSPVVTLVDHFTSVRDPADGGVDGGLRFADRRVRGGADRRGVGGGHGRSLAFGDTAGCAAQRSAGRTSLARVAGSHARAARAVAARPAGRIGQERAFAHGRGLAPARDRAGRCCERGCGADLGVLFHQGRQGAARWVYS